MAREHAPLDVINVPFELRPTMPSEGFSAVEQGLAHSPHVDEHLYRLARDGGYPLVLVDHLPNTHLALTMAELARDAGTETHDALHASIYTAYYGRGEDIGSRDVLLPLGVEVGLNPDDIAAAWDGGVYEDRLHQFRHLAMAMGVDATPAALICNELLIGSRPLGTLRAALERCLAGPERLE